MEKRKALDEERRRLAGRQRSATLFTPSEAEVGMAQKTWEISGGGDALPPAHAAGLTRGER